MMFLLMINVLEDQHVVELAQPEYHFKILVLFLFIGKITYP